MTGRTKRQSVFDLTRGRYVKAIFPKGGHIRGKIAVDATRPPAATNCFVVDDIPTAPRAACLSRRTTCV